MKNFKYLLLSLITIICFSSFTGCDETPPPASGFEFSCNEQIENSVSESMTYFYNNIYTSNLLTNGMTYNFGQLELMYNNFNPYIELGTITNGSFVRDAIKHLKEKSVSEDIILYLKNMDFNNDL